MSEPDIEMPQNEAAGKLDGWPIPELREGRHYYREGEFIVFTELYHRSRGSCCGSGCRHCPFDHLNVR
jgi:hypothetical protein